jgi:Raf kinase inhibitor-like YbhB/YbcL family protein
MRRISPAALAAVLLAAGCGSGSHEAADANTTPPPTPEASTPSVAPTPAIRVSADVFTDGGAIPQDYTCQGAGKRPQISWTGVPGGVTSTALAVTDPDAPSGEFIHWLVLDLPPTAAGRVPAGPVASPAKEEKNSSGSVGWQAPCPPQGTGTHHYHFAIFALTGATPTGDAKAVVAALRQRAVIRGEVVGLVEAK